MLGRAVWAGASMRVVAAPVNIRRASLRLQRDRFICLSKHIGEAGIVPLVAKSRACPTPTVGAGHARRCLSLVKYQEPWFSTVQRLSGAFQAAWLPHVPCRRVYGSRNDLSVST